MHIVCLVLTPRLSLLMFLRGMLLVIFLALSARWYLGLPRSLSARGGLALILVSAGSRGAVEARGSLLAREGELGGHVWALLLLLLARLIAVLRKLVLRVCRGPRIAAAGRGSVWVVVPVALMEVLLRACTGICRGEPEGLVLRARKRVRRR